MSRNTKMRLGIGGSFNDYRRRVEGKTIFPEIQYTLVYGKLEKWNAEQSYDGTSLPVGNDLTDAGSYLSAGARVWLYEGPEMWAHPYAQLGIFSMKNVLGGNARLGIADPNHFVGIGIGPDHDFKGGGNMLAWGWWLDPITGLRVARDGSREREAVAKLAEQGVTVDDTGAIVIETRPAAKPDGDVTVDDTGAIVVRAVPLKKQAPPPKPKHSRVFKFGDGSEIW